MNAIKAIILNPPRNNSLVMSAIAHVIVFLFLTVRAVFFPSDDILISNAVKVDLVALPDKIKTPQVEEKTAPEEPVVEKKKEPTPKKETKKFDLEKTRQDQMKALEKLKSQLAKNQSRPAEDQKPELKKPDPELYKGNILSPGSEIKGVAKIEYDKYFDSVRIKIRSFLVLPQWLKDANLKAQVLVKIDNRGFVIHKALVKSSGNDIYDNLL